MCPFPETKKKAKKFELAPTHPDKIQAKEEAPDYQEEYSYVTDSAEEEEDEVEEEKQRKGEPRVAKSKEPIVAKAGGGKGKPKAKAKGKWHEDSSSDDKEERYERSDAPFLQAAACHEMQ